MEVCFVVLTLWFVVCVYFCLGLNWSGVELDLNWLDKPSVGRNLTNRSRVVGFLLAHPEQHWKGRHSLGDYVAEKDLLPCVGCVDVLGVESDLVKVSTTR